MSTFLLAIAVGPVQDFIAAARRTRDLWFGSYLLSELSKAVAFYLKKECQAELIFPAAHENDLTAGSDFSVANQIIARVDTDNIDHMATQAKEAAHMAWRCFAGKNLFNDISTFVNWDIFAHQVNDILELYAAWVPLGDNNDYAQQRQRLMALLSARKHTRDFRSGQGVAGVPKSLLDGARESVILWQKEGAREALVRKGLKPNEPLDVAGLVKRLAEKKAYPSISRIAADPWLRQLATPNKEDTQELCELADKIAPHIIPRIEEKRYPAFSTFPYDGTLVYLDRRRTIKRDANVIDKTGEKILDWENHKALCSFFKNLLPLYQKNGEPNPYLAVICADGDRMGEALASIGNLEGHQTFSKQLSCFATEARKIVQDRSGVCVFAGGDDVLAFVPIDHCLSCARALYQAFGECLENGKDQKEKKLTLSVGIAIGHFMEELGELRRFAKEAERLAKEDERNGLAIMLHPRGGDTLSFRASWTENPDKSLLSWIHAFREHKLPMRFPHDLRDLLDLYFPKSQQNDLQTDATVICKDIERLLHVKQIQHDKPLWDRLCDLNQTEHARLGIRYTQFNTELLLASRLAAYYPTPKSDEQAKEETHG